MAIARCTLVVVSVLLEVLSAQQGMPLVSYTITTVAGSNYMGDGLPAASALLQQPEGVAQDALGNLYIADAGDHRIRKIGFDGIIETVAGDGFPGSKGDGGPATAARLNTPYGICLDRSGNLYVADLSNARVRKISREGKISTIAGGGQFTPENGGEGGLATDFRLVTPRNVAVDAQDNLYIADFGAHRVYKVSPDGFITTFAGTGEPGFGGDAGPAFRAKIHSPAGLAVDTRGALYIGDTANRKVRRVYQGFITSLPDSAVQMGAVTGLAADTAGNLYLADNANKIMQVSSTGSVSYLPLGGREVAAGPSGRVYITLANQVKLFKDGVSGGLSTLAGNGTGSVSAENAVATGARLQAPTGLASDLLGNVLIAEAAAGRVRKLDSRGYLYSAVTDVQNPTHAAVDRRGYIYVSDTRSNRIYRMTPNSLERFAGSGDAGWQGDQGPASRAVLNAPSALAIDADDNLFIADTGNGRIRMISRNGTISTVAGGGVLAADGPALSTKLSQPMGVAVDSNGGVWFTELGSNRLRVLDRKANLVRTVTDRLKEPRGLRITPEGEAIVADTGNDRVVRVSPTGEITRIAGGDAKGFAGDDRPAAAALLNSPVDVLLEAGGTILVSDFGNNRIRKLGPGLLIGELTQQPIEILHAATLREQPLAMGQIAYINGSAGTEVLFNETPAHIFSSQGQQINVLVPKLAMGTKSAVVTVLYEGAVRATGEVEIVASAPGVLTTPANPMQALATNEDGSLNATGSPAARGSIVVLYITGEGLLEESTRISADLGGFPCDILYAGNAPGLPGLMQMNLRTPSGFVPTGARTLTVQIADKRTQPNVTLTLR